MGVRRVPARGVLRPVGPPPVLSLLESAGFWWRALMNALCGPAAPESDTFERTKEELPIAEKASHRSPTIRAQETRKADQ